MIHNMIVGIMKNNEKPENNTRDLAIAYTIDFTVYTTLGIMGQISVAVLFSIYNADGSQSIPPVITNLSHNTIFHIDYNGSIS